MSLCLFVVSACRLAFAAGWGVWAVCRAGVDRVAGGGREGVAAVCGGMCLGLCVLSIILLFFCVVRKILSPYIIRACVLFCAWCENIL